MARYKKFLVLWFINSALLLLSANFFPLNFTLGHSFLAPIQAAVISGFIWNLTLWYTEPFLKDLEIKLNEPAQMMFVYLFVNFSTLWLLARYAVVTGFGVSSWIYVLGLAVTANLVQYMAWKNMEEK